VSDALKLVTGALVELEPRPDDRVELKINRRVIARGDVVIVDGNYGVRITDIVSPMQRLDTGCQLPVEQGVLSAEMMGQP
jgi:flagellar motor switch protein FliN/FliY